MGKIYVKSERVVNAKPEADVVVSEPTQRKGPVYLPVVLAIFGLVMVFAFVMSKALSKK